jgi:hypothetical protein
MWSIVIFFQSKKVHWQWKILAEIISGTLFEPQAAELLSKNFNHQLHVN